MHSSFPTNTLTNPDQVVGKSTMTRQQLLEAIDAVYAEHGFDRAGLSDRDAPEVTAFGTMMHDSKRGIALTIRAAPSACGTGIVFDAWTGTNFGSGWESSAGGHDYHHWSTSENLIQFGAPRAMKRSFIDRARKSFHSDMRYFEKSESGRKAAAAVSARLGASKNGTLVGPNFTAQVSAVEAGAEVELTLRTSDIDKVAAVLALLKD